MFKIEENTIHLTRGDKATINLTVEDYTLKSGDTIEFRIYNKRGLDKQAILTKEITVETETDSIEIQLTSDETKLGEIVNKPVVYWYEIELNDNQTILGYDKDGAKELILYPEGAEINATE